MSIYKEITRENLTTTKRQVFKQHTLSSSDAGIVNYKFNSEVHLYQLKVLFIIH